MGTPQTKLTRALRKLRAYIPLKIWAVLSAAGEAAAALLAYLAHTPPLRRAAAVEYIEAHFPAAAAQFYTQYVFGPKWWIPAALLISAPILALPELIAYTAIARYIYTMTRRGR